MVKNYRKKTTVGANCGLDNLRSFPLGMRDQETAHSTAQHNSEGYSIRTLISPEFWWILLKWITGCVQTGNAVFDMNSPKFMWILTVFEFFSLHLNSLARPKFSRCFSTQKILLNFTEFCPQFSAKFSKIHLNSPKNCPYGMALKARQMTKCKMRSSSTQKRTSGLNY